MLASALAAFLAVGDPRADAHADPGLTAIALAGGLSVAVAFAIVATAKSWADAPGFIPGACCLPRPQHHVWLARRGHTRHHCACRAEQLGRADVHRLALSGHGRGNRRSDPVATAFRDRLDHSLPPTAAAQPIAGIILGLALLGDHLTVHGGALAVEAVSLVTMPAAVFIIGRSPQLAMPSRDEPASGAPRRNAHRAGNQPLTTLPDEYS